MASGDEEAGVAFVRRYQRRVYGLALSILQDATGAEDVAQEALVRVWRHCAVYDTRKASVATWVLTITRNLAIDAVRMRRSVPIDPDDFVAFGLESSDKDPAEGAVHGDTTAAVQRAVAGLPVPQRRALVLSAFYGLTAEEVSEMEAIPLGTAKTRIRAGLAKVRDALGIVPVSARQSPARPIGLFSGLEGLPEPRGAGQ